MVKAVAVALAGLVALVLVACSDGNANPEGKGAAAVAAGESSATAPPATLGPQTRVILAFGDSLYAGYGLAPGEGLAPRLEQALRADGLDVVVHNGGVSGDTSAAGLARLAFTLDGLPRAPALAIVGLGGNDMLRGISPDETRRNLDAILDEFDRRGIPVLLTGMRAAPNLGADYVTAFEGLYPALARDHDAALYPFMLARVIGQPALMLPDGIHPNAAGVERIVAELAPLARQQLPEPAAAQ